MDMKKRRSGFGLTVGVVVLLLAVALGSLAAPARAAITPQWTAQPDMGKARAQAAIVHDSSGLVYVIGGVEAIAGLTYRDVAFVSSYNTTTGVSHDLAPLPQPTRGAAAAMGADGRIYVFGGWNDTVGTINNTQIYDPKTDAWSSGTAVSERVCEAKAATSAQGLIYVIGGQTPADLYSNVVRVYNPVANSWGAGTNMPVGTEAGALASDGYAMYYIGGVTATGTTSNVWIYYPGGQWYNLAPLPRPVASLAAVMGADGFVYAFGGGTSDIPLEAGYNTTYVFDQFNDVWSDGPDMLVPAKYIGGAATSEGRIFVLGGNNLNAVFNQVESMRVMSVSMVVSSATVGQGRSVTVSITTDFAFAVPKGYSVSASLVSAGITYGEVQTDSPLPGTVAFVVTVPETVAPGPAHIYVFKVSIYYEPSGSTIVPKMWLPITVTAAATSDQQIASLQKNITGLKARLNDTQAKLNQTNAEQSMNVNVVQSDLGSLQRELDKAKANASSASMYGMIALVLLIVVIVLVALMLMMSRKPKT